MAAARLNGIEPLTWLAGVLERMVSGGTEATELEQLLPRSCKADRVEPAIRA